MGSPVGILGAPVSRYGPRRSRQSVRSRGRGAGSRLGPIVALSAAALVFAALPAAATVPVVPTGLTFERAVTHTPVLAAVVSDPDGGAVAGKFFARLAGNSTWDLVNGTQVWTTSGLVARLTLAPLAAGTKVEWTVQSCDATTCTASAAIKSSVVSPMLGAGPRKGATQLPFSLGDRVQGLSLIHI